ncbi:MAG: helix-turn-helix domain-containing protein [Candidatus Acidiferrales bacterium]
MSLLNSELEGFLCSPSRLRALNDEDLVVALRSGCNDALAILFERHSALVLQRVRAILQDDSAADEIVRKVFLDFYRTVNQFSPSAVHLQARLLRCAYPRIMRQGKDLREAELKELELLENEIITRPFCNMIKDARIQKGLSIDEAVEGANAADIDPTKLLRAVGLAIKQGREERHMSRSELSRKTGLSRGKIIDLERGLGDPPLITEFIRISCALGMNPEALDDRVNQFQRNIGGVRKRTLRCRGDSARN